jgi:hypothetical protein
MDPPLLATDSKKQVLSNQLITGYYSNQLKQWFNFLVFGAFMRSPRVVHAIWDGERRT